MIKNSCILLQCVEKFGWLHAKMFFEAGGEIAGIAEADAVGEIADTYVGGGGSDALSFLHPDIADEG